jgi:hypothetical protein
MKSRLDRQNEEIAVLRAQLAEAEAGKEGMVERINILLTRASEKEASDHMPPSIAHSSPPPRVTQTQAAAAPLNQQQAPSAAPPAPAPAPSMSPHQQQLPLAQQAWAQAQGLQTHLAQAEGEIQPPPRRAPLEPLAHLQAPYAPQLSAEAGGGMVGWASALPGVEGAAAVWGQEEGKYGIGFVLQAHVVESAASLSPAHAGGTGGTGGMAGGGVREQYLTVVGVLEGSSSQVSRQVQVGDLVLTAAGVPLRGVAAGEVLGLLDGNFGTSVVLGLQRVNAQGLRYVTYVSLDRRSPPTEIRLNPEVRRAGGVGLVGGGGGGGGGAGPKKKRQP